MLLFPRYRLRLSSAWAASMVAVGLVAAASVALFGQAQSAVYVFAVDQKGEPILDLQPADVSVKEDVGESTIVSVRRFGWPLKVTVLVDNGPESAAALVHYRAALKKFFDGLPSDIPVALIATAPNPRWLIRETRDKVQIARAVNLITPDDGLGRFSDALSEYAKRLDEEFRDVSAEQLPPYLPVLVSIATTHQDGSHVIRESNLKMLTSLRKHRVWTHMIMVSPSRAAGEPGGLPAVEFDQCQNAVIGKLVQEATGGRYVPITGSGTSALSSKILPDVAAQVAVRYIKQMTQHRIIVERPPGAVGPMKNFAVSLPNRPGARFMVSTDGSMP